MDQLTEAITATSSNTGGNVTVLGLLQNMWVREPERVRQMIDARPAARDRIVAVHMPNSHTGRRLRKAFGTLMGNICWDNACSEIGGQASASPKPDYAHVNAVLRRIEPAVVLAFGNAAKDAMRQAVYDGHLIEGPHPAARQRTVTAELQRMAAELRHWMAL